MSLVATRLSLTHRSTIQRGASTPDSWNNPGPPTWNDHVSDLPCRLWVTTGREREIDHTSIVAVETVQLIVPLDTDVTETDRVGDVTFREQLVLAGPMSIRAVLRHQTHIELILLRIS